MVSSRLLRPATRLLSHPQLYNVPRQSILRGPASIAIAVTRRGYATPSGTKDVAVRDALNEALAEELEANNKVFVLGEEVAQYNGA